MSTNIGVLFTWVCCCAIDSCQGAFCVYDSILSPFNSIMEGSIQTKTRYDNTAIVMCVYVLCVCVCVIFVCVYVCVCLCNFRVGVCNFRVCMCNFRVCGCVCACVCVCQCLLLPCFHHISHLFAIFSFYPPLLTFFLYFFPSFLPSFLHLGPHLP